MTKRAWDCRGIIRFCSLFPYSYCRPLAQRAFRSQIYGGFGGTLRLEPSFFCFQFYTAVYSGDQRAFRSPFGNLRVVTLTWKPSGGHNGFGNLRWKTHLDCYKLQKPSCTAYHCVIARRDLKVPTWQSVPPVMEQGIHIMQRRVLRTKGLSGRPLETFGWSH